MLASLTNKPVPKTPPSTGRSPCPHHGEDSSPQGETGSPGTKSRQWLWDFSGSEHPPPHTLASVASSLPHCLLREPQPIFFPQHLCQVQGGQRQSRPVAGNKASGKMRCAAGGGGVVRWAPSSQPGPRTTHPPTHTQDSDLRPHRTTHTCPSPSPITLELVSFCPFCK